MAQIPLGDIERHFWLTRSVARTIGVSFTEALAEKRLTEEDYAELVTRYRAVECTEPCQLWLACQQGRAEAAPEFCTNAEMLNSLR